MSKKKKQRSRVVRYPMRKPAPDDRMSSATGHQRKWRGPSVLNQAQCPPEGILKARDGFLYSIRALQLTHPLSHSPGAGTQKRQPFDMKITQGSIFQGHNEIRPHTQYTGWVGWVGGRGEWNQSLGFQFPGGRGWLFIQPALLISRAVHSLNLTPDRPKSLHWSKKFSTRQLFTYFPFLRPLLPGPSQGERRAPLATESLKGDLHGLRCWQEQCKQRSFQSHPRVLSSGFLVCTLDIRE